MQEKNTTPHIVLVIKVRFTPYFFSGAMKTIIVGREVLVYSRWVTDVFLKPEIKQNTFSLIDKRATKI